MRGPGAHGRRRWIAAIAVAAGMTLAGAVSAPHALAAGSAITGVVEDTSGTPLAGVRVNVLDPTTHATDATTTTNATDGTFTASVASGTYNVEFIPQSGSGLQSYLAPDVTTDAAPLTVILKTATVVQVQGTLTDSQGNIYTGSQGAQITFTSPLNPGSPINPNNSGGYSVALLADQNFTASVLTYTAGFASQVSFSSLPVGTLDTSQTYNLTLPTAQLSVKVVDSTGTPITGGTVQFSNSSLSLPGLPGASAYTYSVNGFPLSSAGIATVTVPNGTTLNNAKVVLTNGLTIPFTLKPLTGTVHAYIIFNATTGQVIVDDQPPVVKGAPDTSPNASGWYNAPVTITWTSTDPAPSSGTPTTPPPTLLSTDGANQTATSAKSCDPGGNCATGTVTGINIDTTPPSVAVTGVTSGGTYSTAPSPACATTDALSGVATNATISVANSRTSYTATCSGATDSAGNAAAPVSVAYQVIPPGYTTASLADSNGNPLSGAAVTFRSSSGSVTNATTGADGIASATLTPGAYSVTMNYATGYQTKTITVTANGPNTVTFATVAVTAQVSDPDSADLAAATIQHAGNTGTYGSKIAVDGNGEVVFQVLPGTNTFTAWDAGGYQAKTVTITGPTTVTFATVAVTVQISDPSSADLAAASATHAGNTGAFGPKTPVDGTGAVTFQVLPGTNTFTAYDAGGYQTQTVTITGTATVTFATVAVTVTVLKNGSPLTTATVTHAGNIGSYGPKTAVDSTTGEVIFQVLPGTNSFTAWDGTAYQSETLTVTSAASTSITVA
jgi:Carboxypeptidase regulatory-like domain